MKIFKYLKKNIKNLKMFSTETNPTNQLLILKYHILHNFWNPPYSLHGIEKQRDSFYI